VQPIGIVHHGFDWCSVDGAVAPTTGAACCCELPHLNRITCQVCLAALTQAFPDRLHLLVLDKRGGHPAKQLVIPEHGRRVWLPPDAPELTPIERVWRDLQDQGAWQQCSAREAQQDYVADVLCGDAAPTLQSLTAYAYFIEAVNALAP
jgi:hypothetical protein